MPHRRHAQMGLQSIAIDHINRPIEQAGNVVFQPDIIEESDMSLGINIDDDVEITIRPTIAARNRAENGGVTDSARAQSVLVASQDGNGVRGVHAENISQDISCGEACGPTNPENRRPCKSGAARVKEGRSHQAKIGAGDMLDCVAAAPREFMPECAVVRVLSGSKAAAMFKQILVPIDLSDLELAKPAIANAAAMARQSGGTLRLINVLPLTPVMLAEYVPPDFEAQQRRTAQDALSIIVKEIALDPSRLSSTVRQGGVHQEILEEATAFKADLIVMSSHRPQKPGLRTYFLGSNAGHVMRYAKCSVLVVRD